MIVSPSPKVSLVAPLSKLSTSPGCSPAAIVTVAWVSVVLSLSVTVMPLSSVTAVVLPPTKVTLGAPTLTTGPNTTLTLVVTGVLLFALPPAASLAVQVSVRVPPFGFTASNCTSLSAAV